MRGEYTMTQTTYQYRLGSPPLARGIQTSVKAPPLLIGITPACAGNTQFNSVSRFPGWDHPRLRGEYLASGNVDTAPPGSPPLARGIHLLICQDLLGFRITPACAGNTSWSVPLNQKRRDHPRLRGEYTKKIPYLQPFPDLHL